MTPDFLAMVLLRDHTHTEAMRVCRTRHDWFWDYGLKRTARVYADTLWYLASNARRWV